MKKRDDMPEWERRMREAGLTPFWELVDDPLTELLERATSVRIINDDEELFDRDSDPEPSNDAA